MPNSVLVRISRLEDLGRGRMTVCRSCHSSMTMWKKWLNGDSPRQSVISFATRRLTCWSAQCGPFTEVCRTLHNTIPPAWPHVANENSNKTLSTKMSTLQSTRLATIQPDEMSNWYIRLQNSRGMKEESANNSDLHGQTEDEMVHVPQVSRELREGCQSSRHLGNFEWFDGHGGGRGPEEHSQASADIVVAGPGSICWGD